MKKQTISYKRAQIDGIGIFYREAGGPSEAGESGKAAKPDKPGKPGKQTIILLNGVPNASSAFQELMHDLKDDFHLIAPDFPGFGNSDIPDKNKFAYTFHNISLTIEHFIDQLGLQHPHVYALVKPLLTLDGIKLFFLNGAKDPQKINPDSYFNALYYLNRPSQQEIQLDLLYDYRTNLAEYPNWQQWLKFTQPRMLLVWGKNDVFFPVSAAEAIQRDVPDAELYVYDTSHLALEEHHTDIAGNIKSFLNK